MGSSVLSTTRLLGFGLAYVLAFPSAAQACPSHDFHTYYTWAEIPTHLMDQEFLGRVQTVTFSAAVWEPQEIETKDGSILKGRKLLKSPRLEFEVVEVVNGEIEVPSTVQDLSITSCGGDIKLTAGQEFYAAGKVVDGRPVLQMFRRKSGGLY